MRMDPAGFEGLADQEGESGGSTVGSRGEGAAAKQQAGSTALRYQCELRQMDAHTFLRYRRA